MSMQLVNASECRILHVKFKKYSWGFFKPPWWEVVSAPCMHPLSVVPNDLISPHHLSNRGHTTDINYILHFALTILVLEKMLYGP